MTKGDLISKMRDARAATNWVPPVPTGPQFYSGSDQVYFAGRDEIRQMEDVLESQNDNLGNDVMSKDGKVIIGGAPLEYAPVLDSVSGSPIYQVDFGSFKTAVQPGEWAVEAGPFKSANGHRVLEWHMDWTFQFICYDRRRNAVFKTT